MEGEPIKRTVLDFDDIASMAPALGKHPKLVKALMHWLNIDKVNDIHSRNCDTPGVEFVERLLRDLEITLRIDGQEVLDNLPEGAFITVSNHPFGALDGISLIDIVARAVPSSRSWSTWCSTA